MCHGKALGRHRPGAVNLFFTLIVAALCLASIGMPMPAQAQEAVASFYRGKQIDLIIGTSAGGGYDAYARLLARHFPNHMPGAPTLVPQNMPGAGSNKAAGYLYTVGKKDGTAMAAVFPGAILEPLLGDKPQVQHDPTKLLYVGSANNEAYVCITRASSPVKSLQDAMLHETTVAASAEGGTTRDFPAMLNNLLGTKFKIISGYPGTREMNLALEQGEVDGQCGFGWSSLLTSQPHWLAEKKITILSQDGMKAHPVIKSMGVPMALDLVKPGPDHDAMALIYSQMVFGRPFILPPGVPADRVAALRKAFIESMRDPALIAEADKLRLDIDPVDGAEMQALIERVYGAPKPIIERAKQALVYRPR